jgi:predicted phosphate transport protein (TIGR00153 family)
MAIFSKSNKVIELLEKFIDSIDQGSIVFKKGVDNYLYGNIQAFENNILTLSKLESDADLLGKDIENRLYKHSLMPQLRGDMLRLLEELDDIIDIMKTNLYQFEVEVPNIPSELNQDLSKLTEMSVATVEALIPAARAFFRSPETVRDQLHRVYFYETEADKLAASIKRKVFREMTDLKLSEKFHLRYFTLHIEQVSDASKKAADLLSVMAIKRTF